MLLTGVFDNVEDCLRHYDFTRTTDGKALTIQSQIRQVYHFKQFLDRVCTSRTRNSYIMTIFKNYKTVLNKLEEMENCDEFQYQNSLNIFSITLGPFEKEIKEQGLQILDLANSLKDKEPDVNVEDNDGNQPNEKESENSQFLRQIAEDQVLKIEIYKLRDSGEIDPIWKFNEWLEYNKMRTSQLIKNITRRKTSKSSQEQYVVILLERILEEFPEPHYGYLRVNISINKINLENGKLNNDEKIKFYFWINVYGVCNMNKLDGNKVFLNYSYVEDIKENGFKLMNDESEMLSLILPDIKNQGDEYEEQYQAYLNKLKQDNKNNDEEAPKIEIKDFFKKIDDKKIEAAMMSKPETGPAAEKAIEDARIAEMKDKEAKLAILKSIDMLSDEFFSDNLVTVPKLFEG